MKVVKLSVQDFAQPCPRTGHLESGVGSVDTETGMLVHQDVQRRRAQAHPKYQAEVKTTYAFERGGFRFEVEGRIDGLFPGKTPKIEEIKTAFDADALAEKLKERGLGHPYVLQILTYAHFHLQHEGIAPDLNLHLVSLRHRRARDLTWTYDGEAYEAWLNLRLDELVLEAERAVARARRRRKVAAQLKFPFAAPRRGQEELVQAVADNLHTHKFQLLQAPTGLGKTVGVLFPVLREALARGSSVFYATPKNSQHAVAEDAVERLCAQGAKLKNLTLTAKSKLCLKDEVFCRPEYCEFARDYHDKVREAGIRDVLRGKRALTAKMFKLLGKKHVVCPYELQWEAAEEADVVIGDYNHAIAPRGALGRIGGLMIDTEGKPNLVVDEAHNLPTRAMDHYSPELTVAAVEDLRAAMKGLPRRWAREGEDLLDTCVGVIQDAAGEGAGSRHVALDPAVFRAHEGEIRQLLNRYLESDVEILPRDPLLAVANLWSGFTEILDEAITGEREEFFITARGRSALKITCCDASAMLRPRYALFEHTVAFSATLRPFDFYARLMGMEGPELALSEFASPFDPAKRKLLIVPQVSTKYSERERNYGKIAEAISRMAALREGNYLAFFPSFAFLEEVHRRFIPPAGFSVRRQSRGAPVAHVEATLEDLRAAERPTILFAVQGGVYSEGIDYPGDMAIGAFVVGPPLPSFDVEREGMKEYYERRYQQGFNYAYAFPAMAKAVQSAGRVIRTEEDRGLVVLLDGRFMAPDYAGSMPVDWFSETPRELVSSSILEDVRSFWSSGP